MRRVRPSVRTWIAASAMLLTACTSSIANGVTALPAPSADITSATAHGSQTAVFAGGCFWGVQSVFQHVKGVQRATSGYAGGNREMANYARVSSGATGHAESVEVVFDPQQVSYGQLLQVFFSVAHDPTQLNAQGPDTGTQYRSEIFFTSPEQQQVAIAYIQQLQASRSFSSPIVTKLEPLTGFYAAEDYHQNYATLHPHDMYIVINDAPKVANLKRSFPGVYVER